MAREPFFTLPSVLRPGCSGRRPATVDRSTGSGRRLGYGSETIVPYLVTLTTSHISVATDPFRSLLHGYGLLLLRTEIGRGTRPMGPRYEREVGARGAFTVARGASACGRLNPTRSSGMSLAKVVHFLP